MIILISAVRRCQDCARRRRCESTRTHDDSGSKLKMIRSFVFCVGLSGPSIGLWRSVLAGLNHNILSSNYSNSHRRGKHVDNDNDDVHQQTIDSDKGDTNDNNDK